MKAQVCTICGKRSIPGLIRGQGKCQYHWDAGAFGKKWADKVHKESGMAANMNLRTELLRATNAEPVLQQDAQEYLRVLNAFN